MRVVSRGAGLALALAVLAACQPLPRPFAPADRGAVDLPSEDAFGVTLRPVSGMPAELAAPFSAALEAALHRRGIPAATSRGRARGALVYGAAARDGDRPGVAVDWRALGRDGRWLGHRRVAAQAPPRDREAALALAERLASRSAEAIASLLRGGGPDRDARPPAIRTVSVAAPPGIDGAVLRRAMAGAMRAAGIEVSPAAGGAALAATVSLGPLAERRRRLRVEWRLDGAGGRRIGALVQENDVDGGTLGAAWPATARLIALAAVDGIAGLLPRRPVDGPPSPP